MRDDAATMGGVALPAQLEESHGPGKYKYGFKIEDDEEDGDQVELDGQLDLRRAHRHNARLEGHVGRLVGAALTQQPGQYQHGQHQEDDRAKIDDER